MSRVCVSAWHIWVHRVTNLSSSKAQKSRYSVCVCVWVRVTSGCIASRTWAAVYMHIFTYIFIHMLFCVCVSAWCIWVHRVTKLRSRMYAYIYIYTTGEEDRPENNYDCQNFKQVFTHRHRHVTFTQMFTGFPNFQTSFHGSKRESPSLERVDRKTVQSGDPNILSLISSESGIYMYSLCVWVRGVCGCMVSRTWAAAMRSRAVCARRKAQESCYCVWHTQ